MIPRVAISASFGTHPYHQSSQFMVTTPLPINGHLPHFDNHGPTVTIGHYICAACFCGKEEEKLANFPQRRTYMFGAACFLQGKASK